MTFAFYLKSRAEALLKAADVAGSHSNEQTAVMDEQSSQLNQSFFFVVFF